ncbi:MAG: 50S ribosomal protein L21 [Coriobacteriales bacterium]|jgi:large subunit ribosomal protein L21
MYAVIKTGGKQYRVSEGDYLDIEKLDAEVGADVEFEVLFICDGSNIIIEPDALAKAKVCGQVVEHFKGEKQIVFKFKKRKNYKRTQGHRQQLTKVYITLVSADGTGEPKKLDDKPSNRQLKRERNAARYAEAVGKAAEAAPAAEEVVEEAAPEAEEVVEKVAAEAEAEVEEAAEVVEEAEEAAEDAE